MCFEAEPGAALMRTGRPITTTSCPTKRRGRSLRQGGSHRSSPKHRRAVRRLEIDHARWVVGRVTARASKTGLRHMSISEDIRARCSSCRETLRSRRRKVSSRAAAPRGGGFSRHRHTPVQAQNARSWVASNGNDGQSCTRALPCLTFGGAYANVVDSADYGPMIISKSITIQNDGAQALE